MNIFEAVVLGAVQGATEFIPVSSTGHLVVIPKLMGWQDPGLTFDLATHVGTLFALLWYFWRDWLTIVSGVFKFLFSFGNVDESTRTNALTGLYIVAGIVPAAILGKLFGDAIEEKLRTELFVAFTTAFFGLVMLAADRLGRKNRPWTAAGLLDWIVVGFAQAIALMPGVSRSGITMTAGLGVGLERDAAARLSFLLSAPTIAGAAAIHLTQPNAVPSGQAPVFAVAIIVSGVVGYLCIKFLLHWLRTRGLAVFVWYRLALAGLLVAVTLLRSNG